MTHFLKISSAVWAFVGFQIVGAAEPSQAAIHPRGPGPARPCPLMGIDPNPAANTDFSPAVKEQAINTIAAAGAQFLVLQAKWSDLETTPGNFSLDSLREELAQASNYGFRVALTLKTIDTNVRSVPADLKDIAWDDPRMIVRFQWMLGALSGILTPQVKWINLGNEINVYLGANPAEIAAFGRFVYAGETIVQLYAPGVSSGLVFSFDALRLNDSVFQLLKSECQHVSFTYYATEGFIGTTAVLTQRPVSTVPSDIRQMEATAAGIPVVITEIGYSSSGDVGSSSEIQSSFYLAVFNSLRNSARHFVAANFEFMSDLPSSEISKLADYYGVGNEYLFRAWLGSLGIVDDAGTPKPAWSTFTSQLRSFNLPGACFR